MKKKSIHIPKTATIQNGNRSVGKKNREPVPAHHHTEECYKTELACTIPEHTHTVECLIDETADVETEADWESTIPQNLTENWAEKCGSDCTEPDGIPGKPEKFQVCR